MSEKLNSISRNLKKVSFSFKDSRSLFFIMIASAMMPWGSALSEEVGEISTSSEGQTLPPPVSVLAGQGNLITSPTIAKMDRAHIPEDVYFKIKQKAGGKYLVSSLENGEVAPANRSASRVSLRLATEAEGDNALWQFNPLSNEGLYSIVNKETNLPINAKGPLESVEIVLAHPDKDHLYNPRFVISPTNPKRGYTILGDTFLRYLNEDGNGSLFFGKIDQGIPTEWVLEQQKSTGIEGRLETDTGPADVPIAEEVSSITKYLTPNIPKISSETIHGFVHPGIFLTKDDMERIRSHVRAGHEPWASAFRGLAEWTPLKVTPEGSRASDFQEITNDNRLMAFYFDASQASDESLMWFISGNEQYRTNALKMIRAWSQMRVINAWEPWLRVAPGIQKLCMAAEILKYTETQLPDNKWSAEDEANFLKLLEVARPSCNHTDKFFNQHSIGNTGMMASAIYRSHFGDYSLSVERTTTNPENKMLQSGAITGAVREMVQNELTKENLISPVVQLMEIGRDQSHAWINIGALGTCAMMAHKQGTRVDPVSGRIASDPSNGISLFRFGNDRLLKAANATAKYNLGYDVPYVSALYKEAGQLFYHNVSHESRGFLSTAIGPVYSYYKYAEKESMTGEGSKYLEQAYRLMQPGGASHDFSSWGTLLYTEDEGKLAALPKIDPRKQDMPKQLWHAANFTALLTGEAVISDDGGTVYARAKASKGKVTMALMNCSSTSAPTVRVQLRVRTHAQSRIALRNVHLGRSPFLDALVPDTSGKWSIVGYLIKIDEKGLGCPLFLTISGSSDVDIDYVQFFDQ